MLASVVVSWLYRVWNKGERDLAESIAPLGQGSDGQAAGFGRGTRTDRTRLWQGFDHEARIARGRGGYRGYFYRLAGSRHPARHRPAPPWPPALHRLPPQTPPDDPP